MASQARRALPRVVVPTRSAFVFFPKSDKSRKASDAYCQVLSVTGSCPAAVHCSQQQAHLEHQAHLKTGHTHTHTHSIAHGQEEGDGGEVGGGHLPDHCCPAVAATQPRLPYSPRQRSPGPPPQCQPPLPSPPHTWQSTCASKVPPERQLAAMHRSQLHVTLAVAKFRHARPSCQSNAYRPCHVHPACAAGTPQQPVDGDWGAASEERATPTHARPPEAVARQPRTTMLQGTRGLAQTGWGSLCAPGDHVLWLGADNRLGPLLDHVRQGVWHADLLGTVQRALVHGKCHRSRSG